MNIGNYFKLEKEKKEKLEKHIKDLEKDLKNLEKDLNRAEGILAGLYEFGYTDEDSRWREQVREIEKINDAIRELEFCIMNF